MSLESFFSPKSVAIVGASRQKNKVGYEILANMIGAGYMGKIYPVNPQADTIEIYNDSRLIGEEDRGKLFKRFSRLSVTQDKKVKGTGLGLFITKEIIAKHGGDIWVGPRENGNSFIF